MDKQAQDEFDKEMRDYLRASVGSFLFWDNELDAEYERVDTPVVPASSLEALTDDYAEVMLREAGNIHSGVWEP